VLFLTLTYPEHYERAPEAWKRHLDLFWRRLKHGYVIKRKGKPDEVHRFPRASCIWRLEFQERGAPHFHLILFDVGWLWYPWLDKAWNDIAGGGDEKHLRAGTECTWPRKWDDARAYVAKYIAKQAKPGEQDGWIVYEDGQCVPNVPKPGRQWGVLGRAHLPESVDELEIPYALFEAIKAILVEARDDERGEEWIRAPFRGLWGTCGPGPIRPHLERAGLIEEPSW
jgi:hypothetical protein